MFFSAFRKLLTAVLFTVFFAAYVFAEGGEPGAFTKIGAGVRAAGMGNAYTAAADDTSAVIYNPAGLVLLPDLQLSAETYFMSFNRAVNFISIGKPFDIHDNVYSVGLSWFNYSAGGDIEVRATDSYEPDSLMSDSANIFIFTAATSLAKNLFIGGNFRYYLQTTGKARGTGVGFDLGALLRINEWLKAGISASNISTNITWSNSTMVEGIPLSAAAGLCAAAREPFDIKGLGLTGSGDILYYGFGFFRARAGAELTWNDFASLRAGFDGSSLSAGAGIKLKPSEIFSITINYAFKPDNILPGESNHRIGLTVDYIFPHFSGVDDETKKIKGDNGKSEW